MLDSSLNCFGLLMLAIGLLSVPAIFGVAAVLDHFRPEREL